MESVSFPEPPPLIGTHEKQNLNKFCDYRGDRGHNTNDCYQLKKQIEEAAASRKLAHPMKDIRQNNQRSESQGRNNVKFAIQHHNRKDWNEKPQSEDDGEGLSRSKRMKRGNILGRNSKKKSKSEQDQVQDVKEILRKLKRVNIKIDPITSSFKVKERRFLGHMVTKEGVRADLEKVQAIILSLTPKSPNQIRSLFLKLTAISKFIPKLAELQYPIHERGGIQILVSYVSRSLQGMEICYTPTERMVQALIHTTSSLRAIFRKHKVKMVTNGPMEEILKLSKRERWLEKWAAKVQTYDISYIQINEAKGSVVKKFFGQGEQVKEIPNENEGGTLNLRKKLQAKSTPTPRSWRLYLGKETIKEGLRVGIILVSPKERMHSYVIRLKFNTTDHTIDYEALLAGLAASVSKGIKDLHIFIDSPKLVAKTEGNHTPATEQEKKYKKEIMDATALFYRFWITHLLKNLNSKVEVLTGLATIKKEFLN
ncbi:gag-pol polyprotein [Tanacetum coccineum]